MSLCARFAVIAVLASSVVVGCGGKEKVASKAVDLPRTTEALFQRNCATCHGEDGRGDGPAAYLLDPKPRDFRKGMFRLVSTDNGVATEDDLVLTITRGMPGTPMPPWPQLSDDERRGLAKHVLSLRRNELIEKVTKRGSTRAEAEKKADKKMKPGEVLSGPKPAGDHSPEQLLASFVELCAKCHAEDGTGRDDPAWRTSEGHPIKSRNFMAGVFKGGRDDVELYRRIAAGMPGTPMPAFSTIPPEQIWKMVTYIQSLSEPVSQTESWIAPAAITVQRINSTPSKPTDAAWNSVEASEVRLLQLWSNPESVRKATVRAVSDGKSLALLMSWRDPQKDIAGRSTTTFNDRAAIMLSTDAEPPLFTMGRPDRDVEIWQWAPAPGDDGITALNDIYPSAKTGWSLERTDEEGVFATAKTVGNPITRGHGGGTLFKAAEFGSLTAVPGDEAPTADGVWVDGEWRVMFRRQLRTARADDIDFSSGKVSIALGIWDGRLGQRNGQKSVSIWGNLQFADGGSK